MISEYPITTKKVISDMMLRHEFVLVMGLLAGSACIATDAPSEPRQSITDIQPLTVAERVAACAQDPRVVVGVASNDACVGADLFFREPFDGNGRTCATCHRVDRNLTIDPAFIATLPATDPLFVAETDPNLANLEKPPIMHQFGLILENVDGFAPDPSTHFVLRSVPHTLSLATSITRAANDPVTIPSDRTGWSGDGAPGNGALRDFLTGAITQHYTKSLNRVVGQDFRLAIAEELRTVEVFMRGTGRTNELNLTNVTMTDAGAQAGRTRFLSVGCNGCHGNAGANAGGGNRNFNTGVETARNTGLAGFPIDGGFLTTPANPDGSFGNRTFNVSPLIEAADTGPFFHTAVTIAGASAHNTAVATTIEEATAFYDSPAFNNSPAGRAVPINLTAAEIDNIGRFLRGVNATFNAAIALKRLDAELAIVAGFHNNALAIQREVLRLASVEINDAIRVLSAVPNLNAAAQSTFTAAVNNINVARTTDIESDRVNATTLARQQVVQASNSIGTNLTYQIGDGVVMF